MFEDLYYEIPESRLYNTYKNIMHRNNGFFGITPPGIGQLYTIDQFKPSVLDFTNSFLSFMDYNRNLLPFNYSVVSTPSFLVFIHDKSNINNQQIVSVPIIVRSYKLPVTATETYIMMCNMQSITPFYNQLVKEIIQMNTLGMHIYFHKLLGQKNIITDTFNFLMRIAVYKKGLVK